jgi:hypothetical protein
LSAILSEVLVIDGADDSNLAVKGNIFYLYERISTIDVYFYLIFFYLFYKLTKSAKVEIKPLRQFAFALIVFEIRSDQNSQNK